MWAQGPIFLKEWQSIVRSLQRRVTLVQAWVAVTAPTPRGHAERLGNREAQIEGKHANPRASSPPCRFQHSPSRRSPAGKTTRPTSRFRTPRGVMTSPSSRTRSTTALPPASTPCTWDSSPPATTSTSTQPPVPTAN